MLFSIIRMLCTSLKSQISMRRNKFWWTVRIFTSSWTLTRSWTTWLCNWHNPLSQLKPHCNNKEMNSHQAGNSSLTMRKQFFLGTSQLLFSLIYIFAINRPDVSVPQCPLAIALVLLTISFLIRCPLPRRKCIGALALSKTKHTALHKTFEQ